MVAARKLRDRLATAAGLAITEEPQVRVPSADKSETLKDEAKRGMEAIDALYAERNTAVELAADMNQKLNHVQAINIGLRDELNYYKQQCLFLSQANARLQAYLAQQHDTFQRIANETHQVNAAIASMPQPAPISNNPDLPRVNSLGLPVQDEPEPRYDNIPTAPPPVDAAELQRIVGRINGNHPPQ